MIEVWSYVVERDANNRPLTFVEQRGDDKWAIVQHGMTLNKDGQWEYEPQPSSRDEDYLQRNRYDGADAALAAWFHWEQAHDRERT